MYHPRDLHFTMKCISEIKKIIKRKYDRKLFRSYFEEVKNIEEYFTTYIHEHYSDYQAIELKSGEEGLDLDQLEEYIPPLASHRAEVGHIYDLPEFDPDPPTMNTPEYTDDMKDIPPGGALVS